MAGYFLYVWAVAGICLGQVDPADNNLLFDAAFQSEKTDSPTVGWQLWKPVYEAAQCQVEKTKEGLVVRADRPYSVGGVFQRIASIKPKTAYKIRVECKLHNVSAPYRMVLVRMMWKRDSVAIHPAGMLVRGPVRQGEVWVFEDILLSPDQANAAELWLEAKWLPRGSKIVWKRAQITETSRPPARVVRVGTVYLRPTNSTPSKNLEEFCKLIDEAGRNHLDIVCLPEAITVVGTGLTMPSVAEPIPGPSTTKLAAAARRNRVWVVAGLIEKSGDCVYNTAVLIDRNGKLAGKYRKVHLPREEWKLGITPGKEYPVFETDFGKVAIQICYDWFFPESHEIFALRGAEILFAPTWGNTLPDQDGIVNGETVFRTRARDNGLYIVPSVYSGKSMVIDPMGRILVSSQGKSGLFWCDIDLSKRECLEWVGYWRSIGPRDRMPETYDDLLRDPQHPTY